MTRPSPLPSAPGLFLVAVAASLLAGCGADSRGAVRACTQATECGAGAFCVQGACQASAPPLADFAAPSGLTTNRVVKVTGTAHDPDRDDHVAGWAWTVRPVAAACEAELDVSDLPTLEVVFWCEGTYEVALVVTDTTGAQSAAVKRSVSVAASTGAPSVTAGAAVAVAHRCAGTPLTCALETPVALSASGQPALGGSVTYRWTALAPDASRAAATVRLLPDANASGPTLAIETGGGPISGEWRLRVRVTDADGRVAQAIQVVSVGNRPPVIDATLLSLDHRYEGGAYRANGILVVPMSDPDGDPLDVAMVLDEPASGCTASLDAGAFALTCPAPGGLRNTDRAVEALAIDSNGASAAKRVPVEVRNRLPVLQPRGGAGVTELSLPHGVGPCPGGVGACFQATGENPFVAVDPDGDPVTEITLVPGVAAGHPASVAEAGAGASAGSFRFSTPVARPAEFRDATGASGFSISATASDPFGASAPAAPLAIRIENRPPVVKTAAPAVSAGHRFDAATSRYLATAPLAVFEDPDGDPLVDGGSTGDPACGVSFASGTAAAACRRDFTVSPTLYPTLSGFAGTHALVAAASDGWAKATSATSVTVTNSPPAVADYTGSIEACTCFCPAWDPDAPTLCQVDGSWIPDPHHATFPVRPLDADGDPVAATFTSTAALSAATVTALPEACTVAVNSLTYPVSVAVTVNDGVSQASATWTATAVVCSKQGQPCTPVRTATRTR